MKRLLLGLMLLVTAGAASAEWTRVGDNYLFFQYVDGATIRRNGNLVKMWDLSDFKTVQTGPSGESYLSQKTQLEYDCKEEKGRRLAYILFGGQMGNGKVVYSDSDTDKWSPNAPESFGEIMWKIACGKK